MFIKISLRKESFLYQRILNPVKDDPLLFVNTAVTIHLNSLLKETPQVIMMSLRDLQIRASLFMHLKTLIGEKINTGGSRERRIPLRKHFSHLLFHNTNKLFTGCNRFLLLTVIELLFMV